MWTIKKLICALSACAASLQMAVPAYADIKIEPSGDGVVIKPGQMPDMTNTSGIKSAIDATVMGNVRDVAMTITAICSIICLVAFLISVTKLAASAGNPIARQRALAGILFSGVALALFGGAWVVVSFFWNFLG